MPEVGTPRQCHRVKADSPTRGMEIVLCACVACTWKQDRSTGTGSFGARPGTKKNFKYPACISLQESWDRNAVFTEGGELLCFASCTPLPGESAVCLGQRKWTQEGTGQCSSADPESKAFVVPWGLLREMSNIPKITKASDTGQQQPARLLMVTREPVSRAPESSRGKRAVIKGK